MVGSRLGPGFESVNDDTTDKRNVVQDTLEEEDDDSKSKHLYGVVDEIELYFT